MVSEVQYAVPVIIDWSRVDWRKMQVKATTPDGKSVVGYISRHRGDPINDICGNIIDDGDFYVFDWAEKVDCGYYGVNYAVKQDSIGIAPAEECV